MLIRNSARLFKMSKCHVEMPSLLCFVVFLHVTDLIADIANLNTQQLFGQSLTCNSSFSDMRVILANNISFAGVYRLADAPGLFVCVTVPVISA